MSQKRTVTGLRSSTAGSGGASGAPHARQKRATSGLSWPQRGQSGMARVYDGFAPIRELRSDRMAEKRYLLTPGPTPVPPEVLAELAKPVIHHRERDYREIYERCLLRLREVYRTGHDVLMFTTSGTGAFESAVANLTSPGDRQLVLSAGNFGERWAGMAKAFG